MKHSRRNFIKTGAIFVAALAQPVKAKTKANQSFTSSLPYIIRPTSPYVVEGSEQLQGMLAPGRLVPGDVVYLAGGQYPGNFTCNLNGTAESPITFKSMPNEQAVIDGNWSFTAASSYCQLQDLEFAGSSFTDRTSAIGGVTKITLGGEGHKVINCIVHDGTQGISGGGMSPNYELYGNLIFYNGYDSHFGHGLYTQHFVNEGRAIHRNNIVFRNFGWGFHNYGSQNLKRFTLERNTSFCNGEIRNAPRPNFLLGGEAGTQDGKVHHNRSWHSTQTEGMSMGYDIENIHTGLNFTNNFIVGDLRLQNQTSPIVMGNNLYGSALGFNPANYPNNTWSTYPNQPFAYFVEPNAYNTNKVHLTIFNPNQQNNRTINVSGIFNNGDNIIARNVQDYWVDKQSLTVSNNKLTINMQAANRSVQAPVGWNAPPTTFPKFGVFVLEKM